MLFTIVWYFQYGKENTALRDWCQRQASLPFKPDVVGSNPFLPCQFTWQGGVGELAGELWFPEYRGVAQLVERR